MQFLLWSDWEQPAIAVEDYRQIPAMVNQELYSNAAQYTVLGVEQFKADVLRYELLLEYGGIYIDTDFEPLKCLSPLLGGRPTPWAFAAWESQGVWINNALMGATPHHPFIAKLVEGLPAHVIALEGQGYRPNKLTGPQYLTKAYRADKQGSGLTVFEKQLFYPYLYNELEKKDQVFPNAYAIHHWANASARRRGITRTTSG